MNPFVSVVPSNWSAYKGSPILTLADKELVTNTAIPAVWLVVQTAA